MSLSLRGVAWTAFAVAVLLLIGSSIFLIRATHALFESESLVAHSREVQAVLGELSSKFFELTNSRRGFIITGDNSFLAEYQEAAAGVPGRFSRLERLVADNPLEEREAALLRSSAQDLENLLETSLDAGPPGASTRAREVELTRQSRVLAARVQSSLEAMREQEDQVLAGRRIASRSDYQHTLRLILASFIIALMLLIAEMFLLSYEFTRHRRTELAARQSREIVDAFFSSSTVGFGILDSQFRYTRVNRVLPRMLGVKPEDLLGKPIFGTMGEQGPHTETILRQVLESGTPILDLEVRAELRGRPGEVRQWQVNYFPIGEGAGAVTQVGITAVDVTARRHAEEALRRLSARLLGIQDQERRRIARELHDSLGQYLAGMKIAIDVLSSRSREHDPLLAECAEILDKAISETRTLSHLLHPPLLDEAGFASAASWFVAGFSQRSGIPVSIDMPPDLPRLPEAVEIALFRVLQESLTNVHRHSQARSAEITVEADAEQVTIEIRDHGRGMPREIVQRVETESSRFGVGLAGMRERIHELGGTLEISSDPRGTAVRATVPLVGEQSLPARAGAEWIA